MPATLLQRFLRRFTDDEESDDDRGFSPSPLDMSVRESHGSNEAAVDRELTRIQQQADEIEQRRRD
ncbi:hypothetical protein [Halohasta salina]|uniref:hypothetical protein n=1 Tax=Halohasta salina TaxID=2961621 RepID=UPI0020A299EB|nr:hypothetical protein [Halohasta salina]